MKSARFRSEIIAGHKGLLVALVPFDPGELWAEKPVRLEGTRHGWLVRGKVNGAPFDGYVGERWGRFFIQLEPEVLKAAKAKVGDTVALEIRAAATATALALARVQSRATTQPGKARPDAVEPAPKVAAPGRRLRSGSLSAPRAAASTADPRRSRSSRRTRR